jgi:hypothetical protein
MRRRKTRQLKDPEKRSMRQVMRKQTRFSIYLRVVVLFSLVLWLPEKGEAERESDEYQHNRAMLSLRQRRKKKNQL